MFPELEQALTYAHSQELEAMAAAEAAAIAKEQAEERKRQLREQQTAQVAEQAAENRREFWRRDIWIMIAVVLVGGTGSVAFIYDQLQKAEQQEVVNRTAVAAKLKDFDLPLYENSSNHEPKGSADIWCDEWKDKKPTVVEFRADWESGNIEHFYDKAAHEAGYEVDSYGLLGRVYRRKSGEAFGLTTISRDNASDVIFCLVENAGTIDTAQGAANHTAKVADVALPEAAAETISAMDDDYGYDPDSSPNDADFPATASLCWEGYCPCDPPQGGPDQLLCDALRRGDADPKMLSAGKSMRDVRRQINESEF